MCAPPAPHPASPEPLGFAEVEELLALRRTARAAEDAGDFAGARRLVRLLPPDDEERAAWLASLEEALQLPGGGGADGGLAAWLLQPAMRHGLAAHGAPLVELAREALRAAGCGARERAARAAGHARLDPVLSDAALFDLGILADYLPTLAPTVLRRAGGLDGWAESPPEVVEVLERSGRLLRLGRLSGQGELIVPAPDADASVGALLYGRLVPVPQPAAEGPSMRFALPPLPVDRITARRVLRLRTRRAPVEHRVRALAAYRHRNGQAVAP